MLDAKEAESPIEAGVKLHTDEGELFDKPDLYRRFVGKLN